ncbi:MAG: S-layer homology domain-containing protein [Clostridiales bacterium]|jgi:hypothetical protein|nr:S-layer homology domain-containing protein [Clostridiales bacterium]
MRRKAVFAAVLAALLAAGTAPARVTYAMTFKDVPAGHWAEKYIDAVTNKGVITGDLSGSFRPDALMDKFEFSRVLAKLSGYKYADANEAEKAAQTAAYAKYANFIKLYSNKFKLWNTNYDQEIAYLLNKGALLEEDLNKFVITTDGDMAEKIMAVTKEELCVFLARVYGKDAAANGYVTAYLFKDDASITAKAKPYVYYFRSLGIVGGDSDNFNPRQYATRAVSAVVVAMAMSVFAPDAVVVTPPASPASVPSPSPSVPAVTSNPPAAVPQVSVVTGAILKIFQAGRAIQITSANELYNNKILLVPDAADIKVAGQAAAFADLREGQTFTGVASDVEITQISVTSAAAPSPSPSQTPIVVPGAPQTISGATLSDKGYDPTDGAPVLTVTLADGTERNYRFAAQASLRRGSAAVKTWTDLRIGDALTMVVQNDAASSVSATGIRSTVDVTVKEIHITDTFSKITAYDANNAKQTYTIIPGMADPYAEGVRVGSRLRLTLDSLEIEKITPLAKTDSAQGSVTAVGSASVTVKPVSPANAAPRTISLDRNTVVIDSERGAVVSSGAIYVGDQVYVVVTGGVAKTITILAE